MSRSVNRPSTPTPSGSLLRRALAIVGTLAAVLLIAGGWLYARSEIDSSPRAPSAAATSTHSGPGKADAGLVERGAYLARAGNCLGCHTDRGGAPGAGGRAIDTPFGTVHAGNLTPDARTGLGAWSADDFWRALHHGRSRDGRMLYPVFPYNHYTLVTREDSDAMFAYLQSLAPVDRANTPHALRWPYNTQLALAVWRALYFRPGNQAPDTTRDAAWNRGAYLVRGLGHCGACHSTRNALGASDLLDLSGGIIPMQAWYAPSLAASDEAGVARWRREQVVQLLRTGRTEGASTLGPMAEVVLHSTQHLSESDLQAMAVFLQALPHAGQPARPAPAAETVVPASLAQRGAFVYEEHCAQCHGARGQGITGAYPALAGNRAVTMPVTANLVQVVVHGAFPPSTAGNPRPFGMPPFALTLSDADVAAVLTHIRTSWGNRAGTVSELDVARQRSFER